MPSNRDDDHRNWIPLMTMSIWTAILLAVVLAYFAQSIEIIPRILVVAWGVFLLYFVWRTARAVEHLAYET